MPGQQGIPGGPGVEQSVAIEIGGAPVAEPIPVAPAQETATPGPASAPALTQEPGQDKAMQAAMQEIDTIAQGAQAGDGGSAPRLDGLAPGGPTDPSGRDLVHNALRGTTDNAHATLEGAIGEPKQEITEDPPAAEVIPADKEPELTLPAPPVAPPEAQPGFVPSAPVQVTEPLPQEQITPRFEDQGENPVQDDQAGEISPEPPQEIPPTGAPVVGPESIDVEDNKAKVDGFLARDIPTEVVRSDQTGMVDKQTFYKAQDLLELQVRVRKYRDDRVPDERIAKIIDEEGLAIEQKYNSGGQG